MTNFDEQAALQRLKATQALLDAAGLLDGHPGRNEVLANMVKIPWVAKALATGKEGGTA